MVIWMGGVIESGPSGECVDGSNGFWSMKNLGTF